MFEVQLKYLKRYVDARTGREKISVRWRDKLVPIHAAPGTTEFLAEYTAAVKQLGAGVKSEAPIGPAPKAQTVNALVVTYYGSTSYTRNISSEEGRKKVKCDCERIRERWGDKLVMDLKKADVRTWMDEIVVHHTLKKGEPAGHGAANNMLRTLNTLLSVGLEYDFEHSHPTAGIKFLDGGSYRAFTDDEVVAYADRWSVGTRERMIFDLGYCTGQRRGDQWQMTRDHFGLGLMAVSPNPGMLKLTQEKTGARIALPAPPRLLASIKAMNTKALVSRLDDTAPVSMREYSEIFSVAVDKAGLPSDCVLHGLRYTCCRVMAEAGCTDHEIMSVSGHQSLAMVQKYTKDVSRQNLATSAMGKVIMWEDARERAKLIA